jgi:Fur family iron response transcriptional regulator
MTVEDVVELLRAHDIQPSAQRVAVGRYVLATDDHPSAEKVFRVCKKTLPVLSRATVYNTLNLFVDKGLLRQLTIAEGNVVFDPKTEPHHHFVDEQTGQIHDVDWSAVKVLRTGDLPGFDVRSYQVIMRGRRV